MTDGMNAIKSTILGIPQEQNLEHMRQLKALRAQDIPSYAPDLPENDRRRLSEKCGRTGKRLIV